MSECVYTICCSISILIWFCFVCFKVEYISFGECVCRLHTTHVYTLFIQTIFISYQLLLDFFFCFVFMAVFAFDFFFQIFICWFIWNYFYTYLYSKIAINIDIITIKLWIKCETFDANWSNNIMGLWSSGGNNNNARKIEYSDFI